MVAVAHLVRFYVDESSVNEFIPKWLVDEAD
jgi:hypothetical protein